MLLARPNRLAPRYLTRGVLLALAWGWASVAALAQTPVRPVPIPPPAGSPLQGIAPAEGPQVAPGLPRPDRPTAAAISTEGTLHAINAVDVDGVTAFPAPVIASLIGNLTGPAIPEGQIESARGAIVDLFRSQGYVYTTARARLTGTSLRFEVVEGYVSEVKLDGDVGPAGTQVLRFLRRLVGQKPLKTASLERVLLLAQDIPGLTVRSVLNPSLGDPGALTLVAQVSHRKVSGYLSADNRAFSLVGPEQALGVINLDSFTELGERTQLSVFSSFDRSNLFGQASEEVFLGGSGLKLKVYGGLGFAAPNGDLKDIGYNSNTRILGGQLSYPLLRTREQTLTTALLFDALESDVTNTQGTNGAKQRGSFDSLRIARVGVDYALLDTLLGPERAGVNGTFVKISQGLPWLGASRNNDTTTPPPRALEKIDFTKIAGEISRNQTLFSPYTDATVGLVTTVGWQYTNDLLPSAEKYYLGGPRFNRGYYFGQVSGDRAVTVSAELQFTTPLPMPKFVPFDVRAQFYGFYDWGNAWQNTYLESDVSLRSTGGGVRLFVSRSTEIDFEGTYRMNRYPNGQINVSALKSAAFYWQVLHRF